MGQMFNCSWISCVICVNGVKVWVMRFGGAVGGDAVWGLKWCPVSECNLRCGVQWAACTTGGDLKNSLIAVVQLESCLVGFFLFARRGSRVWVSLVSYVPASEPSDVCWTRGGQMFVGLEVGENKIQGFVSLFLRRYHYKASWLP